MYKPGKASILYSIALTILSIFQLYLIYGLFTSPGFLDTVTDMYVDGEDFAPIFNLFISGTNFMVYKISVVFYMLFGAVLSLVAMKILRRYSVSLLTAQAKKFNALLTIAAGVICILISCCFCRFTLISDAVLLYIPVPVVSWFSFHLGKKKNERPTAAAS